MYIGTKPQSGFISQEANQYFTGLTQNYIDLNQSISSLSSVIVLVNGVVQENSDLTLTSSTRITLGATLVSGDKVTCIYVAKISSTQAPAIGSVTSDMLSGSIANSKLANSSITLNGSAVSLGGSASVDNTPSFYAYLGSNQTISNATDTKITLDTEGWDTDSAFASNKFTVPSGEGGKYLFNFSGKTDLAIDTFAYISVRVNNSTVVRSTQGTVKPNATGNALLNSSVIVSLSATDYVELFIYQNSGSAQLAYANYCSLMGCKLIGV